MSVVENPGSTLPVRPVMVKRPGRPRVNQMEPDVPSVSVLEEIESMSIEEMDTDESAASFEPVS